MLTYTLLFITSAVLSFLLAYPVRSLALVLNVVDHPEKRKMHQIPIPLMGGLGIFISFAVVSAFALLWGSDLQQGHMRSYLGMLAGSALVILLGIYDDARGLKAPVKFVGQTLAALVVVTTGDRVEMFTNPLGDTFRMGWLGIPLAVFWIVGVTNAVNLIDGLDGLAVGICGIAALGLFAIAAPENAFVATLTIILAGAALGFLKHNFYPARLFLGDTGSMFIGFSLAVIGLHGSFKSTTATMLFLPIIVLGIPIFDTFFAILRRAKRRVSPFKADREHIHHRLVRIGLHHRSVVLVLYFVCAYLALTAYSIAQFPYQTAFLFLILLTIGGIIGVRALQFIEERLETGLAPAHSGGGHVAISNGKARNGRGANGSSRQWGGDFHTMVCEVGGFREGMHEPAGRLSLCADIESMLLRRVRVHAVVAEPSAPGHLLLIVRTEKLKPAMAALVRDGLAWYLEEHRQRFSEEPDFPRIRWIGTGLSEATPEGASSVGGSWAGSEASTQGRESPPLRAGPAGLVGS
ncbi:MAG TPA: MraY family glycosyltransferase [Candidatus Polarisedimenticolia bacterium]|jgi:UDP-GlcNAc:undecaprenyl-phosphate GlcNAc-1-phosphate transferase